MKTHSYVTMRDFVFYSVSVILVINCNRIERERERGGENGGRATLLKTPRNVCI